MKRQRSIDEQRRSSPVTDPALATLLREAVPFALPLRRRFRGTTQREGLLLRGPSGWGEFSPFPDYSDAASARWLAAAVEASYGSWPDPLRTSVLVNAIIPAVSADDAAALTREAVLERGCTTIKVKVAEAGQTRLDDEARVAAVRDALDSVAGRGVGMIRLDANGAWTVDDAVRSLKRLSAYGLEYVEQPCASLGELEQVRRQTDVAVAADESIRWSDEVEDLRGRVDVAIMKVAPLGGVRRCLELVERVGIDVVVSGSLDSAVGLSAGLALAALLPERACGLGTGALLQADVISRPMVPSHGVLSVVRVAPDLDALLEARDRLPEGGAAAWRERLAAAWENGASDAVGHLVA